MCCGDRPHSGWPLRPMFSSFRLVPGGHARRGTIQEGQGVDCRHVAAVAIRPLMQDGSFAFSEMVTALFRRAWMARHQNYYVLQEDVVPPHALCTMRWVNFYDRNRYRQGIERSGRRERKEAPMLLFPLLAATRCRHTKRCLHDLPKISSRMGEGVETLFFRCLFIHSHNHFSFNQPPTLQP